MLKRLIAALAVLAMPLAASVPAQASSELAMDWAAKAAELQADTQDYIGAIDAGYEPVISTIYILEIERFSVTAGRLSSWLLSREAPGLACIMSQIAEDTALEAETLRTSSDVRSQRAALRDISGRLADAILVAKASARHGLSTLAVRAPVSAPCPAARVDARFIAD